MSQTKDLPKPAADFKEELTHFDSAKLSHTDTVEKTPLAHDAMLYGVEHFQKDKLHHARTQEKNILPGKDAIAAEKSQQEFRGGIEQFDKGKLKHAETQEKNPLPSKETIAQEKSL